MGLNPKHRFLWVAVLGLSLFLPVGGVEASEESYAHGMMRKLGRGTANLTTAIMEPVRNYELVRRKEGMIAGLSVGVLQGTVSLLKRVVAGGYEILTFPLPVPRDWGPILYPEYIYRNGDWVE